MDIIDGIEDDRTEFVGGDADGMLHGQMLTHVLLAAAVVRAVRRANV